MKRKITLYAAFLITVSIFAFGGSTWATENIRTTKHNLSASRTVDNNIQSTTTEVCVFCHTPHGGRTDVAGGAAPLWNRNLPSDTGYTMYVSPNFDAEGALRTGKPMGVSIACLSCHDGTVALDSLINYPGSGSDPSTIGLTKNTARVDANGYMKNDTGFSFPMLSKDLSDDHPISMKIPVNDPQFKEIRDNLVSTDPEGGIGNTRLGVKKVAYLWRGTSNTDLPSDPRDRIRAYPSAQDGEAYIECASCHNPHEATATRFLRYPSASTTEKTAAGLGVPGTEGDRNKGSLVCLTCHQK